MTTLKLLEPFTGPHLSTPNRVVLAPMTRNRAGESRVANEMMGEYYAQRSTGGLLITEACDVSPAAIGYPGTPGLYSAEMVAGWSQVVGAVRRAQATPGPFFCQLFHSGRVSHGSLRADGSPGVGPSAIAAGLDLYTPVGLVPAAVPTALDATGIAQTVADYVAAAKGAIEAGFDGVEINGGNGYLIHQFLSDGSNQRSDTYGGSIDNRLRFALEVVDAVAAAVGAGRVGLRVSPVNGINGVEESDLDGVYLALAQALAGRGLAYLHVIEPADDCRITPRMREVFPGTLVVNNGYDRDKAEAAIRYGLADLVSFGRPFLADPDLPRRFAEGADLNEADPATFYGGTEVGYLDYPTLP
jgi:N-ethylmaleimide reductase